MQDISDYHHQMESFRKVYHGHQRAAKDHQVSNGD